MSEQKTLFMEKIARVLACKKSTIKMMRSQRMMNLRLIEKSARSKKDPSPISSAMSTMGLKYPISIDRKKAVEYKVPYKFLMGGKKGEDSHTHGRVLCKKEAIDWWVEHSAVPDEKMIKVIDILYKHCRKEVAEYYSINWEQSSIVFGQPVIERKFVRTREPSFEVPKEIRNAVLKESLFPHLTLPDRRVTPNVRAGVQELIQLEMESKMSLSSQIRILINSMDPRVRCLPILPGASDITARLKHAICHSNAVLKGIAVADPTKSHDSTLKLLQVAITSVIKESKKHRWDRSAILDVMQSFKIQGLSIEEILLNMQVKSTKEVKFAKAVYGIPDNLEWEYNGFIACAALHKVRIHAGLNKAHFKFHYVSGNEHVNFKYGDIRGNFNHSNCILISLALNYTTKRDLILALCEIAICISWEFSNTHGATKENVHRAIRNKVTSEPWTLISCDKDTFDNISWRQDKCTYGCMVVTNNTEYASFGKVDLELSRELNVKVVGTGQEIEISVNKDWLKSYTADIVCSKGRMVHYFTFKRMVSHRYLFYLERWKTVMDKVRRGIFNWENSMITPHLGTFSRSFSKSCRRILTTLSNDDTWDRSYGSFLYMFCWKEPLNVDDCPIKITIREGYTIDLNAKTGIFTFDEGSKKYRLFGVSSGEESEKYDIGNALDGCLTGYKISSLDYPDAAMKSIRYLEENVDSIEDGSIFKIFIGGEQYHAIRDSSITYTHVQTNSRQLRERDLSLQMVARTAPSEKRPWLVGHINEEESHPKRSKMEVRSSFDDGVDYFDMFPCDMPYGGDNWNIDDF